MKLETRELSAQTWRDFEKLFTRGNGWDFCWCMHFQRCREQPGPQGRLRRAGRTKINRRDKATLVMEGRAHGILVYADGEPVGWCQYGPREELPRIDENKNYRTLAAVESGEKLWRITCFVVDKRYRRRGLAGVALQAAIEAIRKKGGRIVEAFPMSECREGTFGNTSTCGTEGMFRREGFEVVGVFGKTAHARNVMMRKEL